MRTASLAESDDDIMVLSNSPSASSNDASEQQRETAQQSNVLDNGSIPMGMGFPIPSSSLVNNSLYPADASFLAAMGSQMPFYVSFFFKFPFQFRNLLKK